MPRHTYYFALGQSTPEGTVLFEEILKYGKSLGVEMHTEMHNTLATLQIETDSKAVALMILVVYGSYADYYDQSGSVQRTSLWGSK